MASRSPQSTRRRTGTTLASAIVPISPPMSSDEAETKSPSVRASATKKWASNPGDWERLRPLISTMYLEQGKTLKEIMAYMAEEHGHHGTRRMYQKRFLTWGLSKNKHEDDMLFVLHKMQQRESLGKKTAFTVRGSVVNKQDVARYFSRKGGMPANPIPPQVSMPAHISYRTPSPEPRESPPKESIEDEAETRPKSRARHKSITPSRHALKVEVSSAMTSPSSERRHSSFATEQLPDGSYLSCLSTRDVRRRFSQSPEMYQQPSPVQIYRLSEELVFSITAYFDSSFGTKAFVVDEKGECVSIKHPGPESTQNLFRFYGGCVTASNMLKKNSYVEARRMLSNACDLVKPILAAENSRTLDCFLEMFLKLKKEGHDDILNLLRRYMSEMARTLAVTGRLGGYWAKICRLIGLLDSEQLEGALVEAWRCTCAAFSRNLGPLHNITMRCYAEYIRWRFADNAAAAEHMFRTMFQQCEKSPGHYQQTILCMGGLARSLVNQQKYMEYKTVAFELLKRVRARGEYHNSFRHELMALDHLVLAGYKLNDFNLAEHYLKEEIRIITLNLGEADPKAIDSWKLLETYLREWGRYEEADEVKVNVEILTGRDDIVDEVAELLS